MFVDTDVTIRLAPRRSAMFPAIRRRVEQVRPSGARRSLEPVRSINLSSLRDDEAVRKPLSGKQAVDGLRQSCTDQKSIKLRWFPVSVSGSASIGVHLWLISSPMKAQAFPPSSPIPPVSQPASCASHDRDGPSP